MLVQARNSILTSRITTIARHLAARAYIRTLQWSSACTEYQKLLAEWTGPTVRLGEAPAHDCQQHDLGSLGNIDCIHREFCLALLRAVQSESSDATLRLEMAVQLCDHVLRWRPQDVLCLILMSEAKLQLGQLQNSLACIEVATRILEYAHASQAQPALSDILQAAGLTSFSEVGHALVACYNQLGVLYWRDNRPDDAVDALGKAILDGAPACQLKSQAMRNLLSLQKTIQRRAAPRRSP